MIRITAPPCRAWWLPYVYTIYGVVCYLSRVSTGKHLQALKPFTRVFKLAKCEAVSPKFIRANLTASSFSLPANLSVSLLVWNVECIRIWTGPDYGALVGTLKHPMDHCEQACPYVHTYEKGRRRLWPVMGFPLHTQVLTTLSRRIDLRETKRTWN